MRTPPPSVSSGDVLDLVADRPVAGGRMLARHDGRVVFVAGAIPGEHVRAQVERVDRRAIWAAVSEVVDPSADRRVPRSDPPCGGLSYAHIRPERQRALKAAIVTDAFRRIGRVPLDPPQVEGSPETGYRLRARLHVRGGRAGFFREGTHALCDARATGQLLAPAHDAIDAVLEGLGSRCAEVDALIVAENAAASERVVHLEPRNGARFDDLEGRTALPPGLRGLTAGTPGEGKLVVLAGAPTVTDAAGSLVGGDLRLDGPIAWVRHATSFFQGNRFLTGRLVRRVLDLTEGERLVDLYAGVGLFAVPLAARGARVLAVEGDRSSGADLRANAAPWRERLHVVRDAVETVVASPLDPPPDAVVVDPPRTGLSPMALRGVLGWKPRRLVYVSCDPPTLARDSAQLVEAGYTIGGIDAFDLFPNTPHVEVVARFDRAPAAHAG
jgi:23S rRNA (uracil1939-C5)-methyltransferase